MSVMTEKSETITGIGYYEARQLADVIPFLQAPNANRLGLFAEINVCSHCGHLILLKKEDEKFYHVEIHKHYIGVDAHKQLHLSYEFRFEIKCRTAIYEVEPVDPITGISCTVVEICCLCNNPEPLVEDFLETSIIDSFRLLDLKNNGRIRESDTYELLPLPKSPLRQPTLLTPIDKLMEPDEKDDEPKKKKEAKT